VILKFAELHFKEAKQRVFSIAIGKKVIVENLDVYDKVGFSTAHDIYLEFQYKKNKLLFNDEECKEALNECKN